MYGSSFIIVTRSPRASRIAASEAAAMPLPSEDTTPPVTKTSGVTGLGEVMGKGTRWKAPFYRLAPDPARREPPAGAAARRKRRDAAAGTLTTPPPARILRASAARPPHASPR